MSQHTINITGVPSSSIMSASPPPRRPIQDVVSDPKAFSLFVQALARLEQADQSVPASHFQIGGIHGQPFVEWDGSGGKGSVSDDWPGYCTHGTVNFPTWHRPYVALYEQVIQGYAAQIANEYTTSDKSDWVNAAAAFRLPYWDWASNSVPPPEVISETQVTITGPDGSSQTVTNPLYAYKFHSVSDGGFDSPWSHWATTLRCPDGTSSRAKTDPKQVASNLTGRNGAIAYQLKQSTYVLLTQIHNWLNMSNHSSDINSDYASSLEAIHDKIHSYVGGDNNGHMGNPAVAGHDPLFFMHHANVDRILSLWQAINYNEFVPQSTAEDGTWAWAAGSTIDETTPLEPFWKSANAYWTSDTVRDFRAFNYSYPEFDGLDLSDKDAVKAAITAKVNTLYGQAFIRPRPRAFNTLAAVAKSTTALVAANDGADAEDPPRSPLFTNPGGPIQPPTNPGGPIKPPTNNMPHLGPGPVVTHPMQHHGDGDHGGATNPGGPIQPPTAGMGPGPVIPPNMGGEPQIPLGPGPEIPPNPLPPANSGDEDDEHRMVDWRVRVLTPKYKLGGPYSVLIFLGTVPTPPITSHNEAQELRNAPSLVGSVEVFANSHPGSCPNCRARSGMTVEGVVYLNHALMQAEQDGDLHSYEPKEVSKYLKENIHWRVVQGGKIVNIEQQLPELRVSVVEVPIHFNPADDGAPHRMGDVKHHHSITHGRMGGASVPEE